MPPKRLILVTAAVATFLAVGTVGILGVRRMEGRARATEELLQTVHAAEPQDPARVAVFLRKGADPNARYGPQHSAFVDRLALWVPLVGGTGAFDNSLAVQRRRPVLVEAARYGSVETVRALLQAGAKPDAADATGETALRAAVRRDARAVAAVLLENGADPKQVSDSDRSAASAALQSLLRTHGAR